MSRRAGTGRGWLLLAANLALAALLVVTAQVRPYAAPQEDDDNLFAVPDHALVVEAKVTRVRVIRQSGNMGLDAQGQVRFGPSGLNQPAEIEAEVTGTVTATLANSSTEVLSGATVQYEIPKLNLRGTLTEGLPGRYSATVTTRARLSSSQALNQVDAAISSWRTRSRPVYLNHRMATSFGFLDYLANTVFSQGQPAGAHELPLNVRLNARLAADNGQPLSGKTLQGRLELPDQGYSETIQVASDANGGIEYTRQESVRVKVEGGTLQTLSSPLQFGRLSRQITLVGLDGVSRDYKLPLSLNADNPLVLFWWGELGQVARGFVSDLLKRMFGQPDSPESIAGLDPIDLTVGNVYSTYVDLGLPGRGLGISFERTYNSRDDTVGPLGFGWRHSYEVRLIPQADGSIVEVDEDGTWRWYSPDGSGGFRAPPGSYSVLTRLADGRYRLRRKGGLTLGFLSDGKLDFLEDPNGNRVSGSYGPSGLLSSLRDPGGRIVEFFYGSEGRLVRLRDPAGREVQYEYRGEDLAASVDPEGRRTEYGYDSAHQLTSIKDPNGRLSTFSYDSENRARSFSYEQGQHKVVLSYNPDQKKTFVTNGRGYRTEHRYEEIGGVRLVTERVDSTGGIIRTAWDAGRNRTSVTDPLGRTTRFEYDPRGNLIKVTDADQKVTLFAYEPTFDRLTSATDVAGVRAEYRYDSRGNLLEVQSLRPGDQAVLARSLFTYDSSGQLLTAADPNGRVTRYSYDAAGNLQTVRDPLDRLTQFTYDAIGNVLTLTDPLGRVTQFTYDRRNRLTQVTAPDGSITGFTYDAKGNRTAVTAPGGLRTQYQYDPSDRLVQVTDPASQTVQYEYDPEGNLIRVNDGESRPTRYTYDSLDRLVRVRNALDLAGQYAYDAAGNWVSQTRPDGTVLNFTYDSLNRLTEVASVRAEPVEARTPLARFTYDALDRRTSMTDLLGTTAYSYDPLSRLTVVDGPNANDTLSYVYDSVGNRTRLTDPDGNVTTYAYDALDRLQTVTSSAGTFTYTYDANGNVSALSLPNGLTTTYSYDSLDRVTRLTTSNPQGALVDLASTYDLSGRQTRVTGTVPGLSGVVPVTVDYTYDASSQLTGETRSGSSPYAITYAYDRAHNRTEQVRDGVKTVWSVDAANRLTTIRRQGVQTWMNVAVTGSTDSTASSVMVNGFFATLDRTKTPVSWSQWVTLSEGESTLKVIAKDSLGNPRESQVPVKVVDPTKRAFTYDANGNVTEELSVGTGVATRYAYDLLNRLTEVTRRATASSPPEVLYACSYDGEDRRFRVTEGGVTTTYLYEGSLPMLERRSDGTVARYVWGLSDGEGAGGLLAWGTFAGALFPLYDGSGNVLAWTNSQGQVVGSLGYTAFGQILYRETASPPAQGASLSVLGTGVGSTPSVPQIGYGTKAFSTAAAGLIHFAGEAYRADLGRLTTPDPSGQRNGSNLYIYGENAPLSIPSPGSWVPPYPDPPSPRPLPRRVVPPTGLDKHGTDAEAVPSAETAQPPPPGDNPNVSKASPGKGGGGRGSKASGRSGKQSRLRSLLRDIFVSRGDKGWIRQELNRIRRRQRTTVRVPPGKELAHRRGYEARKGYGYEHSDLQGPDLHKLQHKYEGYQ